MKENCEKIWKILKKVSWIVKRYGKYGKRVSWVVNRFEKYGKNPSWIVKRFGKYRRKLWKDMKNMEEKVFFCHI
jgi:septation ring formation regulator EzrA